MLTPIVDCITTIIPVFNRSRMLCEAVNSVFSQTHKTFEIIIVDDGSTDETPEISRQLVQKNPEVVRYIRQENAGPGAARNTGLRHAQGEFIQYLDSDDLLESKKFELQVQALREHPEAGVAYCITLRKNLVTGQTRTWARTAEKIGNIFPEFLMKRGWDTNSPLWRRSVCEAIGPWGDFRCMEDWEYDLRAGMLGIKAIHIPEPLVVIRDHNGHRASGIDSGFTPEFTQDFFRAHRSIWIKMREAQLTDWQYLESFSHKMFWIARLCGERKLITEAEEALSFSAEMSASQNRLRLLQLFTFLINMFGWSLTVSFSEGIKKISCHLRITS